MNAKRKQSIDVGQTEPMHLGTTRGWPLLRTRGKRNGLYLLVSLLMCICTTTAQADETEGPWTYLSYRSAFTNFDQYHATAYNSLGRVAWGNCSVQQYHNSDGLGFRVKGNSSAGEKNCVFSVYTHTETIPAYTRKVLTWNFKLKSSSDAHVQTTALYARDNVDAIKSMEVDFTEDYTNQTNSQYRIALQKGICYETKSSDFTHDFDFDNSNSSTASDKKWALLLTHVIGNKGGSQSLNQWGGFKNTDYSWTTYYYKHFTFDNNGGSGSMPKQTIENSGELSACTLTRSGYCFAGWNTQADGSGTSYADQATINATESDKGEIKLYAQWVSIANNLQAEFLQKDRKVKLTWTIQKGQTGEGKFVIYRNDEKIGTVAHTFLNNESADFIFEDTNTSTETFFPNESDINYDVYFVLNGWDEDTKLQGLKASKVVNTTRKVPVNGIKATSEVDRIIFTWTSDGYPSGWGNQFNIYIDDETTPVYTITPTENQTSFQWEHRRDINHTERQNGVDGTIHFTSESGLDVCSPHNYRVEGVIGTTILNSATINNKSIGEGTIFKSFTATKGVYPGIVKLSWNVALGKEGAKTYIVERKRAEKDEAWTELYRTSSDNEFLTYTDDTPLPGIYYDYRITVQDKCDNGNIFSNEITDIGFAQSTGTMSGRITFGATGTSVANVDVEVVKTGDNDDDYEQYHAIRFKDANGAVSWAYPANGSDNASNYTNKLKTGDFTIQLWINPTQLTEAKVIKLNDETCYLGMTSDGKLQLWNNSDVYTFDHAVLTAGTYNHVTLTRSGTTLACHVVGADAAGVPMLNSSTQTLSGNLDMTDATQLSIGYFIGYVDEFRLWTKALTTNEIMENYDHLLVGNEKNLETYWTFDEGLQTQFFDYSRDGTVYHQHHGKMGGSDVEPSNLTADKLKLKAKTDRDGNYIIKGIPFSGEGTTYAVIPSLGIHQFNPTQQLRYVGNSSLVHNSTDFTDISSFPVRGTIRYEGTTYPVEGVNFYVDGQICAKDGTPITTDADGKYEISVPIGEHYITVAKQGHSFVNEGRYPEDPQKTGSLKNYNDAVSNLDFEDNTLVTVAGRVTGGNIEEEKPLGFGVSKNNIGQATITLTINEKYRLNVKRNSIGDFEDNEEDSEVSSPTPDVKSTTVRTGSISGDTKTIIIKTDPQTGEFAALLPPLDYKVESIKIKSNNDITFNDLPMLYASDPLNTETDSLELEDGSKKAFEYVVKMIESYYATPVLEITQKDRTDGSYGEKNYTYTDPRTQEETKLTLYTTPENAPVSYTYEKPIFLQMEQYTFNVHGYEAYMNYDNDADNPEVDIVPLRNVPVTFTNQMGTGQGVVINPDKTEKVDDKFGDLDEIIPDELTLNEDGLGIYQWQAGFPNITWPYTLSLSANFIHNDREYEWKQADQTNALEGIVVGSLPTGNNFITKGPDKVSMIIRDPGGSASSAFWEKGSSSTYTETQTVTVSEEAELMTHTEFGIELTTLMAAGVGVIMGVIETNSDKVTLDVGVKSEFEHVSNNTRTTTTSSLERISTSSEPEYVGAKGDIFIGNSTNIIFGNARSVGFTKEANEDNIKLSLFNNYVVGQEFKTHFKYTQNFIENTMIPELISLRNNILINGVDEEGLLYHTDLDPKDENFGADDTYTTEKPANSTKDYSDMVLYYNQQIANWEHQLYLNEKAKVDAIDNRRRWLKTNVSFDSGSFIDSEVTHETVTSETVSNSFNASIVGGAGTGISIFGQDVDISFQTTTTAGKSWEESSEFTSTNTTGYSLAESGDDDALTIDIFNAPDGKGAIFVTRGGQTTCPYEGELRTKYYEPGKHVISAATMQIEMPKIAVENAANHAVGVPAGSSAHYTLLLTNDSETGEDCYFSLFAIDETNPNGAGLHVNGNELGEGRNVLVPAGGTVRMALELVQNAEGDTEYKDIAIVLASQCQSDPASTWDVIGDTVYISASFVPASTDVTLQLDNKVVNTSTKGFLPITVKDYDANYPGLQYIAVQYQGVGETNWYNARRYVMKESDIVTTGIDEVLPKDGIINLDFDMTSLSDRTYRFRAISARTYGSDVVTNQSDEFLVVKDMSRPKALGLPQPADGILSAADEVSVLFNEAILNGQLSEDDNFRVTGVLNGSTIAHQTALELQNTTQAAATESSINLSNKDFSIDTWVNINGAGTLLSHGTGTQKLTIGVNADSKLTVKIGNQTYTSLADMPQNKWAFLTLSLTKDGQLSASVADGSGNTTTLFNELSAIAYEGNGPLAVGQQMTGAMHELLLWDEVRSTAVALAQRSLTKNPATSGLIGYWKMDEGEGTTITDYARNRHMTMAAETWHLENENKAVTLDGSHYVGITTKDLSPLPQDDYAVELWVKAGKQAADAQLLQLGEASLVIKSDGSLTLENNDSPYGLDNLSELTTADVQITDNAWHHVALSVLRGGNANSYVDGVAKASVSANEVGSLGSDMLLIGARRISQDKNTSDVLYQYDRALTGTVDEVRIWKATMNASQLKKQRKVHLTGTEPGLVAYYPFEAYALTNGGQTVASNNAADQSGSMYLAQMYPLSVPVQDAEYQIAETDYTDNGPAIRVKPEERKVGFTFTASDNKIVIGLKENPELLEGCTVNFTVFNVQDQNGNLSEPIEWSAYISQNPLMWKESVVSATTTVTAGTTLTATLVNKGGKEQVWTLSSLPAWLEADMEVGNLLPLAEQTITFTVSESTPIGKYEQTVYVKGNDGIITPLTLNINVTGNMPDWAVNLHDYETSMNIVGVVKKDGTYLTDSDDILAAFVGDECRGLAHLEYNERYDNYYVTMDIYSNTNDAGQTVNFRAYDASTGTIYPVVTWNSEEPFQLIPQSLLGTYAAPIEFNIQDLVEQQMELKTGWNWISFTVAAEDMTMQELFKTVADDVETVKSHSGFASYVDGGWWGTQTGSLSNAEMYAVKMKADRKLRVVGSTVKSAVTITSGWNWLGYYGPQIASLADALAGMEKTNGDIVKAQSGFAYWDNNEWSGSRQIIEPGMGFKLMNTGDNQSFAYPGVVVAGAPQYAPNLAMANGKPSMFSPISFRNYPENATMSAKVVANGQPLRQVELAAFAGDECRTAAMTDDEGNAYLTIPGDETCELTFKVAVGDELVNVPLTLTYETDAIYGSPKHPVMIDLGEMTGIYEILNGTNGETIYDLSGRKILNIKKQNSTLKKGVYIINGQKKTVK